MPESKATVEMDQRKSGLAVPPEAVDACRHAEVFGRIKPQVNQFHCQGCDDKVVMVVLQFAVMTLPEFEAFKRQQVAAYTAARRKQATGLVTPDDVRREQGKPK